MLTDVTAGLVAGADWEDVAEVMPAEGPVDWLDDEAVVIADCALVPLVTKVTAGGLDPRYAYAPMPTTRQ